MDSQPQPPHNRFVSLTVVGLVVVAVVCIGMFIANLQPGRWLISNTLAYPELISASGNQNTFTTMIGREIAAGNTYRLPADIVSFAIHLVAPASFVRYIYLGILLIVAAVGAFALSKQWLVKAKYASPEVGAVTSALIYISSAFAIQTLFSINSGLITAFAFLPVLIWLSGNYISSGRLHWLGLFALASILGLEIGSDVILFIATLLIMIITGISWAKISSRGWLRLAYLGLLYAIVNVVWIMPNLLSGNLISGMGTDATVANHLPIAAQILNNGSLNTAKLVSQFQTDWVSHWQSPVIGILLFLPLVIGLGLCVWLIILRKHQYRLIAMFTLISGLLLILLNIGISIDSLSWSQVGALKQVLGLITGLGIALAVGRFVQWADIKLMRRLSKSQALGLAVGIVTMTFYVFLTINPVFQNHLYPTSNQTQLPESFAQLYSYFQENPTSGNVLYVTDNLQQDPTSQEFTLNSLPVDKYAISQQLIAYADDSTAKAYTDLIHAVSGGNNVQINALWQKYDVDFVVIDQSSLQSDVPPVTAEMGPILSKLTSLQKIDRIDAGRNELAIYKVNGSDANEALQLVTPSPAAALPPPSDISLSPQTELTVADAASTKTVLYPFRNLSPDRMVINHTAQTVRLLNQVDANTDTFMQFPALSQLKLESMTVSLTPVDGQLKVMLNDAYPVITTDDTPVNAALGNINLVTIPMPAAQYMLVLGDQNYGPFNPGVAQSLKIDNLNLAETQNLRIYEIYDSNNVTAQFQESKARNCITYDLIPGSDTTVSGGDLKFTSPEDICIAADLPVIETDASVLTITSYDYIANNSLTQCMFSKLVSDCINRNLPDTSNLDGKKHHAQVIEELGKVGLRDLQTKFFLRKTTSESDRAATLSNIQISEYKLTNSVTIDIPGWNTPQTLGVNNVSTIQAVLPYSSVDSADFNSATYVDSFKTCDGANQKVELIPQQNQHALQITSQGKLCVQKDFAGLRTGRGHFLFLDYKLPSQATVNMCVWDIAHNICIQNATLTGSDIRQEVIIPIPRKGQETASYRMIFKSGGTGEVQLVFSDLQLVELNTDTLQSIFLSQTLPSPAAFATANPTATSTGYQISVSDPDAAGKLLLFSKPNDGSLKLIKAEGSADPISLFARSSSAITTLTANGEQQAWNVQAGDYLLVNENTISAELLLIFQAIILITLLGLPAAKEVLVSGIMKKST